MSTQHDHWEREHAEVAIHAPMDKTEPSRGVTAFLDLLRLQGRDLASLHGIEMGCGKGRNAIWLAEQGVRMTAFDFSEKAIAEAKRRSKVTNLLDDQPHFLVHDATIQWPFPDSTFDLGIDCFASSDIDSPAGREFARNELLRILKPGAFLFVHAIAATSPFHAGMIRTSPGNEPGSFLHPSGKFEKTFEEDELRSFYESFQILALEHVRSATPTTFYGKDHLCENFWCLLRKKFD
jgi:SAM-dependent methyltransferase